MLLLLFILPFMLPLPMLPFMLELPEFMLELPEFMLELAEFMLELAEFMLLEFMLLMLELLMLALLVFSAGEHAVQTLATASNATSAKVLRIDFLLYPPGGQIVGELHGLSRAVPLERFRNSSGSMV
ncbi:MAG: hypothetical protein LC802_13540 [Acidobacteria bacterium]|nr:hypothetical protein [Acidobacteriota bacterium]